ncbi:cell division FtsA domain-containing protein [Oceanotoga teriensis]|jgi:cell division protein FtsA|uniref:Cell division protein FtsA n=1 Tax=Oceanotoga teriensis TaxID=515440 RepID=A0AA45C770_9BACT|nr:cell division FtsA domain-containing protein [Oceanotoga teriensis]MDO7976680.1 pilus assembly protein PilM [Oceanotoga teriensis]PWJ95201.1 cell division protein FtsA [Oceanotoga teriensis]
MIFSLDVGTRTLIGVIAELDKDEKLIIKDSIIQEHENRAMMDGQIHDVHKVAKGVQKIIEKFKENGFTDLKNVAVALAGRFLITSTGEYTQDISTEGYIEKELVKKMELEAVKRATENLDYSKGMYCVGYSVLYYELDEEWIKHLEGQKGNKANVKVISAFLPKNVVEAMMSVLEKNSLNPVHITLEPIAAINLVVPEDLRNLNIAMIDVGAGTSDIAISNEGTIKAYGMVPIAGDEITEAISKELLIDFSTAEKIKKELSINEEFTYKDILDFEQKTDKKNIEKIINPIIENAAVEISEKIIELNGKPPVAVMIVGGGGKVLGFKEKIAEKLGLPENRVALKDIETIKDIIYLKEPLIGSEYITPVGIANSALKREGNVFNHVKINGTTINMMMIGTDLNVMQVLLQYGYSISQLIGVPSNAITYELNGEFKIKKGNMGKEALIKINNQIANLKSKIKPGDEIEVGVPEKGEPLELKIKDIINPINITINGIKKELYPKVKINGKDLNMNEKIKDGDKLETKNPKVYEVLDEKSSTIIFTINGKTYETSSNIVIIKNDEIIDENNEIKNNDSIILKAVDMPQIKKFLDIKLKSRKIIFNEELIELNEQKILIKKSGKQISENSKIENNANYTVDIQEIQPNIISLFSHLSMDVKNVKNYRLMINGKEAKSFMTILEDGDKVRFDYK